MPFPVPVSSFKFPFIECGGIMASGDASTMIGIVPGFISSRHPGYFNLLPASSGLSGVFFRRYGYLNQLTPPFSNVSQYDIRFVVWHSSISVDLLMVQNRA